MKQSSAPASCVELLDVLKKKMKFNDLSVLVGSGFSKNVNDKAFPSWWELLRDIVMQLQGDAFQQEYATAQMLHSDLLPERQFFQKKADAHIEKIGPLRVVSDFIKMKGFREVIDAYIEERTPILKVEDKRKVLVYWEETEIKELPVSDEDLAAHYKLIKLPWNNIYTTNYDNLLESCINVDQKKLFIDAIEDLMDALQEIETKKAEHETRIEEVNAILDTLSTEGKISGSESSLSESGSTALTHDAGSLTEGQVTSLKREKLQLEGQVRIFDVQKQRWASKLGRYEMLVSECLFLVTDSSGLAVKKNKNVIKLHGSLRRSDEEAFGFDNDPHAHYVIAHEDYETYPTKHEAFTQLMRISLLRESFCLVGFSGADPNFLAWIGWVRDVIQKNANNSTNKDHKIYLIDMTDAPASADKALFYRNHRIAHITLMSDECIDFLLTETHRFGIDRKSRKEVLSLFLDYLNMGTLKDRSEIGMEVLGREAYDGLTSDLGAIVHEAYLEGRSKVGVMAAFLSNADKMDSLRKYNRIPSLDFSHDHFKYNFLRFADDHLDKANANSGQFEKCLRIVEHFSRDQFLPASIIFAGVGLAQFDRVMAFAKQGPPETYARYLAWNLRNAVWNNSADEIALTINQLGGHSADWIADEITYQKAWYAAFNLQFSDLFAVLDSWDPKGYRITQKAGLLSLFSIEDAEKLLDAASPDLIQEELYALELRYCLHPFIKQKERAVLSEQISSIEAGGLKDVRSHIDYLLIEATPKEQEKIRPYGADKNRIVDGINLSNINVNLKTLQILGVLIEAGLQVSLPTGYFIQKEKLYPKLKPLIPVAPFPILFFLAQYSDKEFSKTVGEDYIYRIVNEEVLQTTSASIQAAYNDSKTPSRIKNNLLNFYSSLILRLDCEKWQHFALENWRNAIREDTFFENDPRSNPSFLFNALRFIKNPAIISEIITDCLNEFNSDGVKKHSTVINSLYEISNNPFFKANADSIAQLLGYRIVERTIEHLQAGGSGFNVLGNLYAILSEQDRNSIREKMKGIDLRAVATPSLWRTMVYFASPDKELLSRIKMHILVDVGLWDAGFTNQGISSKSDFIRLHQFRTINGEQNGVQWTAEEARFIYEGLVATFGKIEAALIKRSELYVFKYILEEMSFFLEDEEEQLQYIDGYSALKRRLGETYHQQRKFSEIAEGLRSADSSVVIWAVGEFSRGLYLSGGMDTGKKEIDIILQRIIWKMPAGLLFCLEAISIWVYDFRDSPYTRTYAEILEQILATYHNRELSFETDLSDLEESLVKIAFVLYAWGIRSARVWSFYQLLDTSVFNNVRYGLKYTLIGTLEPGALEKPASLQT